MPGAGHLVHMPSHIYWRVGRYADAVDVNVDAVKADRQYMAKRTPSPIYRGLYYPHNIDFIWQSASMQGRSAETIRAAREFAETAPPAMLREMPDMETAAAAPLVSLARFGRWEEILRQPAPPAEFPYVTAAWHYSRGLAFAATGRRPEAEGELAAIRRIAGSVSPDRSLAFFFKAKTILDLAANVLAGEIAARAGQTDVAVRHLLAAVAEQDGHWFTEPRPGTSRSGNRSAPLSFPAGVRSRPRPCTGTTSSGTPRTDGPSTGWLRASRRRARRPRPPRSRPASRRPGPGPT